MTYNEALEYIHSRPRMKNTEVMNEIERQVNEDGV